MVPYAGDSFKPEPQVTSPEAINFAPLVTVNYSKLSGTGELAIHEAELLFQAATTFGFFYLDLRETSSAQSAKPSSSGHENILKEVRELFGVMKQLFDLELEEKLRYDISNFGGFFGYKGIGKLIIDKDGTPDCNEFYNISKDDLLLQSPKRLPQPSVVKSNLPLLTSFMLHSHHIVGTILSHLSNSLRLQPINNPSSNQDGLAHREVLPGLHKLDSLSEDQITFIKYPTQEPEKSAQQPLASHTDYGSITILFTEMLGLQVLLDGKWLYVKPMAGKAIVNCGDALSLLTNGKIHSNTHRVVSQIERYSTSTRYSLGYFSRPGNDVRLEALSGELVPSSEEQGEKKEVYHSREWVMKRIKPRMVQNYNNVRDWERATGTEQPHG